MSLSSVSGISIYWKSFFSILEKGNHYLHSSLRTGPPSRRPRTWTGPATGPPVESSAVRHFDLTDPGTMGSLRTPVRDSEKWARVPSDWGRTVCTSVISTYSGTLLHGSRTGTGSFVGLGVRTTQQVPVQYDTPKSAPWHTSFHRKQEGGSTHHPCHCVGLCDERSARNESKVPRTLQEVGGGL